MPEEDVKAPAAQTVDLTVQQKGNEPAKAIVSMSVPPAASPLSPGWVVAGKFLDPSALAALGSTILGLMMLWYQPERELAAWALVATGGLLVPVLGTMRRLSNGNKTT